ncbi:hydroxysqualene dehydroxylase HpnE [Pseudonocardia hispaniensis]|uniref:Hydroxysqualene dehydroxylase HpnE n=1 Tax=Pseudonocardia hispaniensis TaxID=904933 RepID=A0ABW1J5N7_9PSEU
MTLRVGVIGGGLAGITAALRCADAGCAVTLVESRPRLGGLAASFRRGELDIDTGQHVFLRCCTSYRALLDRLGVTDQVVLQARLDIAVHAPGRRPSRLRRTRLPAPLHLAGALLRYRPLAVRDRLRLIGAALAMRALDPTDPRTDARSFAEWLTEHGQSDRAVAALWDLVGVATLNATADRASLALAATVFQQGLLTDPAAGDIGWSRVPLGRLHDDAAGRALRAAEVDVRLSTKARRLAARPDGGWRLTLTRAVDHEEELVFDRIVCAVPPTAADRLLPPATLRYPPGWAARLGSSPIVNAHVVYDRRVLEPEFVAALDSPLQWVFDRTAAAGLHRRWPPDAQYLAVSLSAADSLITRPTAQLRAALLPALAALLPAARKAAVLDFFVTREPHATFRAAPGSAALRPPARTQAPGLFLAGAWTDTGWPATMEGAVRSGATAAHALLAGVGPVRTEAAA